MMEGFSLKEKILPEESCKKEEIGVE